MSGPKTSLHIALDYDGTYTADPGLWDQFIKFAQGRGHRVTVITMRHPEQPVSADLEVDIIYTSLKAKAGFLEADIWIDDKPYLVNSDHWGSE